MDEYVSRDYLLGEYDRQHQGPPGGARKIIAEAPTADVVKVMHGRLLNPNPYGACSLCGYLIDIRDSYNYCPNCGAKMDDNAIQHTECVGNALSALDEVEELSRYIDANKMADELSKVPWHDRKDEKQAVRMAKEFPAADVVEVVKCRECKYHDGIRCFRWNSVIVTRFDDYCSNGERKDGGQDK